MSYSLLVQGKVEVCGDVKELLQKNVNLKQLLGLLENEEEQRERGVSALPDIKHPTSMLLLGILSKYTQ